MTDKPESEATVFLALESICDAFESALQTDSSARIEDYLTKVGSHQQERLLRELCLIEIQHRIDRKEEVSLAEYAQRFPAHRESLESLVKENPRWGLELNPPDLGETLGTNSPPEFTSSANWQSVETVAAVGKSTDPANPPSSRFGDYELIEKIGQGGMGVIYRARQQKLNRIVAVKMIRAGKLAAPADIQRFQSEAEAIGRLEHPQIVPIYEVDQVEGIHFFSMAFVDGEDLAQKLRQGPLPQRQAAQLVCEIALAIHYAHQQGIIHRDLKPANILLTRDGQIRVTDFGLAKLQDAEHGQTVTGDVVGTPGYMSPEQAAGQRASVGTASDIYSLGAILYSLLTGRPPFHAATMVDTLLQVINDSPVSPRQVNPALDRDLETICLKCLEKTASRRYPTAQDLSDELQRFIDGHPIEARPVGVLSRVWRWSCRRPKLAAAWSTVAALLLFLSIAGPLAAIYQTQLKTAANQSAQESLQSAAKYRKEQLRANAKATEAERTLYDTRILLAQSALENNNPVYTRQLLGFYQDPSTGHDYRGFEWHYVNQQLHQETCSINPHPGFSIMDVAIPPQSTPAEFATLGGGGFLRIWQIDGIMQRQKISGPPSWALHRLQRRRSVTCRRFHSRVRFVFFDAKTLKLEKQVKTGSEAIDMIDLLPGGKRCIVRNHMGAILSVQVDTGDVTVIRQANSDRWPGNGRFACSIDGKYLAFIDAQRKVAFLDLEQGKPQYLDVSTLSRRGGCLALALSREGRFLVYGDRRGEISIRQPSKEVAYSRSHDHSAAIEQMIITPDNRFVVSAGQDRAIRMTAVYDRESKRVLNGHEGSVTCLAVAPNNAFIVSADGAGKVKVFPLTDNNLWTHHGQEGGGIAFHPRESRYVLAKTNATLEIWDHGAIKPTRTLSGHGKAGSSDVAGRSVKWLTFHPQGKQLAAGLGDGTICTWNPDTGKYLRSWKGHDSPTQSLAYSPDGTRLASLSSEDETLKIWNTDTAKIVRSIPFIPYSFKLSWNKDGTRIVSGTSGFRSMVIDITSGKTIFALPGENGIYTPDGKHILYIENDKKGKRNTIIACDALTGKETGRLQGHVARIADLAISADSQRVISLDYEGIITIWNMNTGVQLLNLPAPEGYPWRPAVYRIAWQNAGVPRCPHHSLVHGQDYRALPRGGRSLTDKPEGEATAFLALESICDAFESALQTDSSARIEDYLAKVGSHQQERLLRELCLIEIQHRIDRKEEVSLAEYAQRFPAHRESLESLVKENPRWGLELNPPDPGETLGTNSPPEFTSSANWQSLETVAAMGKSTDPENPPSCRFGDYELIEKIGQGGMGVIYKARQQKLNRIVAVKMIRAGKLAAPADIQRFQSEAEAIGRLEHPQIVPIYEVDQVEGIHFFSMAFVDGEDLAQKLRQGPLPQRQAAQLVCEIALAIHYAHQQGIIHRDLKPANILLTRDGQIRVTDFGLAKLQDAEHGQTVTGDVVGTPGYMSPEQAAGQRASVGTASDIYSLGAILYSLLAGRPPFHAATMVDTLLQVINDSPVSPRQVNPALDRDLETICLKCLEKTASRRYPTAHDLSDELQRFIDGHPIEARPVGVLSRVWRWSCRRPKLAAAWSTVAALLLFLSIAGPLAAIYQTQLKTAANQSAQDSLQSAAKYRKEQVRADAKATEAEHALYDTRMILAQSALENNNPGYTRQLLGFYQDPSTGNDYRGFEWHYLNQQVHQEICSINPHPGFAIMDVATPPSRTQRGVRLRNKSPVSDIFEFATLGGDGLLRIWQIDGIMKREVSLGPSGGYCMDYKDDGQLIVVGSKSGEIRFFDVKTLKQEKRVKVGSDDIFDIDLCPPNDRGEERCIVRNNKGAILSLNLETDDVKMIAPALTLQSGKPLQEDYWNPQRRFACDVDGKYLAFNMLSNIAIWDLEQGLLKHTVKGTETRNSILRTSREEEHQSEYWRTALSAPTAIEKSEYSNGGELIRLAPALHLTRGGGHAGAGKQGWRDHLMDDRRQHFRRQIP